ncbi:aminoacetone oxidase family FAD-binding enzyme [Candidatus Desantisbacteria bacterium CG02_land_8_20_14_3_00_49_13]|nr:MAG: aminoacetone oxidase family FAD-binding enzyme [Candidatus Desantisbacteria bacterium CG02_land_8_20_14_3_00_49_13]
MKQAKVIVVGGGAAGMMAAGRAAERGAEAFLLEKTESPGKKLLITGKDRCNFTNSAELDAFIREFGNKGNFLYPAFFNFFNEDLKKFFEGLGVKSKVERGGRVFPASDRSEDIHKALLNYMKSGRVNLLYETRVKDLVVRKGRVSAVKTKADEAIGCSSVILCTGGVSYPGTGSTGDGYKIAKKHGHTITELSPALVPLETKEEWPKELQGLSLENVRVTAKCSYKKIAEEFGDMLFTHFGVSGPIILSMSKKIGKWLANKNPPLSPFSEGGDKKDSVERSSVVLIIDLKPALDLEKLDQRLRRDLIKYSNKTFGNSLDDLLPKSLIPVIVRFSFIPEDKPANTITRKERRYLAELLKALPFEISKTRPIEEAIITSGGIALEEIDNRTMESKIVKGLYFAGEVVDLDAPTGGYNLQMAFSTGRLAGESASRNS